MVQEEPGEHPDVVGYYLGLGSEAFFGSFWQRIPDEKLKTLELPYVPLAVRELVSVEWESAYGVEATCATKARTDRFGVPYVRLKLTHPKADAVVVESYPMHECEKEMVPFIDAALEFLHGNPKWDES